MSEILQNFVLEPDAIQMLEAYQIPYPKHATAKNADEAVRFADEIGYPVVLKIVSYDAVHKSDVGGVLVNLKNAAQVEDAYHQIIENVQAHFPGAQIEGILVVEQASEGVEIIIGALDDPTFGATVMFGLGGIFAEVLKDVTFRIAPLERHDAQEMLREIKGYPLLSGVRGAPPSDLNAIVELLLSVSKMVAENPRIAELDLNPVRVYASGLLVLDARIMLSEP